MEKYVAYYRVSTQRQGKSGLGLEAQEAAVMDYLGDKADNLVASFTEVESGKIADRPKLSEALAACRLHQARLIIAKLDRLSRDAHFLLGLKKSGVSFVAADMPEANEMVVGIMAVVAENERQMISQRTKAALRAAKERGVTLGKPENFSNEGRAKGRVNSLITRQSQANQRKADIMPVIQQAQEAGCHSLCAIADFLNSQGIPTAQGKRWSHKQISRLMKGKENG